MRDYSERTKKYAGPFSVSFSKMFYVIYTVKPADVTREP